MLSNRADLISGGDALVEIKWPAGTNLAATLVDLNGVSIRSSFDMRSNGRFIGLVTGLRNDTNVLLARHSAGAAQITITNYPVGGPVFSGGQQLAPWICATKAVAAVPVTAPDDPTLTGTTNTRASGLSSDPIDAQCNTPTEYLYYYQPITKVGTGCTFAITGANPCFVAYNGKPPTRRRYRELYERSRGRCQEPAALGERHDQSRDLSDSQLLRSRSTMGALDTAKGLERQADVEDGRSDLRQSL